MDEKELEALKASMNSQSSLNNEQVETPEITNTGLETPEVKVEEPTLNDDDEAKAEAFFEERLAKKTGGKKWADLSKDIEEYQKIKPEYETLKTTPKDEFADDEIRHWNELKKKGVKFDDDFWQLQRADYDKLNPSKDAMKINVELFKLRDENKGLSDKALEFKVRKEYNLDDWSTKDADDLTEDDLVQQELFLRDTQKNLDKLKQTKAERLLSIQPDPKVEQTKQLEQKQRQENWEKFIDNDIAPKITKFKQEFKDDDGTSDFSFEYPKTDIKDVTDRMKAMPKDLNAYWSLFQGEDGKIDDRKVFENMLIVKNKDKILDLAFNNAKALGAKKEISELKNIQFKPKDANSKSTFVPSNEAEAIKQAAKEQLK
jgi:hypothetical protein